METTTAQTNTQLTAPSAALINKTAATTTTQPNVFDFVDYREFLKVSFEYKKFKNPAYSESAFIQAAGMGKNSRGYLSLIIKGKRNLSTNSILGFAQAIKLNPKETMYFENMVNFNQSEDEKKKSFFFERMNVAAMNEKGKAFQILESQYRYMSKWYLVVLREMVNLKDFKEDAAWISRRIRRPITKEEVAEGLKDLENLGLLTRNAKGNLTQSEPIISFNDNKHNFKNALELHRDFASQIYTSLERDPYEKRAARLTTISCSHKRFEELRADMRKFAEEMLIKYTKSTDGEPDVILQLGMQLFHITE